MKLHLPLRLRAGLLACLLSLPVFNSTIASGAGVAADKTLLSTPTLGADSVYTLTEVDAEGDFTITKYVWDATTLTLTPVLYDIDIISLGTEASLEWIESPLTATSILYKGPQYIPASDVTTSEASMQRVDAVSANIDRNFVGIIMEIIDGSAAAQAQGAALYHIEDFDNLTIKGHFVGNIALANSSNISLSAGGAIYATKTISSLSGDFIRNSAQAYTTSTTGNAEGGAIYTTAYLKSITGDFTGNYAYSYAEQTSSADGGAIYSKTNIGSITGDFINNYVFAGTSQASRTATTISGGALYAGGTLGTLKGDFIGNYAEIAGVSTSYVRGGAFYNYANSSSIESSFIGNYIKTKTLAGGGETAITTLTGGAFYNTSKAHSLKGDFIGNYIKGNSSESNESAGAAIFNNNTILYIEGLFSGNYIESTTTTTTLDSISALAYGAAIANNDGDEVGTVVADFVGNYVMSTATSNDTLKAQSFGGAMYNGVASTIASVTGNFLGNYAKVETLNDDDGRAQGGGVFNLKGTIGFLAMDTSMEFTGNYSFDNGVKVSSAIYNSGGTLHFNSYGSHSISVNDSIDGEAGLKDSQMIYINNGMDGEGNAIIDAGAAFSTVVFNNVISNQTINVQGGTLTLGAFASTTLASGQVVEASSALLSNTDLHIEAGGQVDTLASYLGSSSTITNAGRMSIRTGTLSNDVSSTGLITITGDVILQSTLNLSYSGTTRRLSPGLSIASGSSLTTGPGGAIVIDLAHAGSNWYNFITWVDPSEALTDTELSSMLSVSINGVVSSANYYDLTATAQGFSISSLNAKYELIPVAAGVTPAVFSVTNYDGNVYDVVIADPLGESSSDPMKYYKWVVDATTGNLSLTTADAATADISANSVNNTAVDTSLPTWTGTEVNHSFIGLMTQALNHKKLTVDDFNISGDFVANTISYIYNPTSSVPDVLHTGLSSAGVENVLSILTMKGDFVGNALIGSVRLETADYIALSGSITARGAAVSNQGEMGTIEGDFIGNFVNASVYVRNNASSASASATLYAQGGAFYNTGDIDSISGDFIGNYVYAYARALTGSFPESVEVAQGGAIHNEGVISRLEGNFIANYVALDDKGDYTAQGGAISNIGGSIGILALNRSTHFTGNYATEYELDEITHNYSASHISNAIHNEGDVGNNAIINLNAYGAHTLTMNDAITGGENKGAYQILNINNGMDGELKEIAAMGASFSTVYFNNKVSDQQIHVHAGTLEFGSYDGAETELERSYLEVYSAAEVYAKADYLGAGNKIVNYSSMYLAGGTLSNLITGDGTIYVTADLSSDASLLGNNVVLDPDTALTLTRGILSKELSGGTGSKIIIAGNVEANADDLGLDTEISNFTHTLTLNGGTLGVVVSGASSPAGPIHIDGDVRSSADNLKVRTEVYENRTLTLTGGTLTVDVNDKGVLVIDGEVTSNANWLNTSTEVLADATLTLTGGVMTDSLYGAGNAHIIGEVTLSATLGTESLDLSYDAATLDMGSLHLVQGGSIDTNSLSSITLNFNELAGGSHTWSDFISWDSAVSTGLSLESLTNMVNVNYNGTQLHSNFYTISEAGDAYTLTINEYTDIKYQLIALEPTSPLQTELVVNPSVAGNSVASSVVFDGPLGDNPTETVAGIEGETGFLVWETAQEGFVILKKSSDNDADITIYSANNTRVDTSDASFTAIEVKHSVFEQALGGSTLDEDLQGAALSHTKNSSIDVSADFVWNSVEVFVVDGNADHANAQVRGAAVYNGSQIGTFSGDLVGNVLATHVLIASSDAVEVNAQALGQGGGMYNAGSVDELHGDFIRNTVAIQLEATAAAMQQAHTQSTAQGAGLFNEGTLDNVTSDFIANILYIKTTATGADGSSSTFTAQGAGMYNTADNVIMESDFIGNLISIDGGSGVAEGAGFYNAGGSIVLQAVTRSIQMTDNTVTVDGLSRSSGIFNAGTAGDVASVTLNASGAHTLAINDAISGTAGQRENQLLHINNGSDGTVYITNLVENQSMTLHAGELMLGAYNSANAMLSDVTLQIAAGASLTTYANFLGEKNTIANEGIVNIAGGTLTNALTGGGRINITENTQSDADLLGNNVNIADAKGLSLTGGVLNVKVTGGVDSLIGILGSVSSVADNLQVETYVADKQTLTLLSGTLGVLVEAGGIESKLIIDGDVSTAAANLAVNTHLTENNTLSLLGGKLDTFISGDQGSRLSILDDVSSKADYMGLSTEIAAGKTLTIEGGTLGAAISGGQNSSILITENVSSKADFIGVSTEIANKKVLFIGDGTLSSNITGPGSLVINGEVTTNADLLGTNTQINEDKTLIINAGDINSLITGAGTTRITTDMTVNNDNLASRVSVDAGITLTLEDCELAQDVSDAGRMNIVGTVSYYSSHTNTGGTHLNDGGNILRIEGNHNHSLSGNALTLQGSHSSLTKLHVTEGSALSFASADSFINLYARDNDLTAEGFSWTIITWEYGAHMVSQSELLTHLQLNDNSNLEEQGFYITLGDDELSYILTDARPAPDSYHIMAWSYNGKAGANLLNDTIVSGMKAGTDLQGVLNSMDEIYKESDGATIESDHLAAALAGASVTSIGSSMMSNIRGQLQKVHNRAGGFVPEGESNFWISAENSRYKLDGEGTAAGHNISNWGGSVGVQRGVGEDTSIGFAFTALYGDLDAQSVDRLEGDMDSVFASFMAQHQSGMWTHHFIASYGHADIYLDRSVSHRNGSYETEGKTKGYSLGFMYEAGYDMQLGESTILTPVFNASIAHSYVDGYTETGSDAALDVGEQENTYATLGAGARIAHTLDMGLQLGARALVKFDVGDSEQETDVRLAEVPGSSGHLRGTEAGLMGFELGMGASLPVGESGAIFMDATVELRDNQENYNASVGYKLSF